MKSRIGTLDGLKYICALGVVFLHTLNNAGLSSKDGNLYLLCQGIYSILAYLPAVEIFFIISAFLLFKKMPVSEDRKSLYIDLKTCKNYIARLSVIYVCWSIFYLPMIVENWPGRSALHNLLSFIRHYIFGYSMQMWYVPSTIVGTIIVVLSLKYLNNIIAWLIAMLLFVFGLSCSGYANIFQNQFSELWLRYFFSVALIRAPIYIMLGYFLAKKRILEKKNANIKILAIGWIVSGSLRLLEMNLSRKYAFGLNADVTIFKPLSALFAVSFCIELFDYFEDVMVKHTRLFALLGSLSTTVYFSHVIFIKAIYYLIPNCNPAALFLMVSILSTVMGLLLYKYRRLRLIRLLM